MAKREAGPDRSGWIHGIRLTARVYLAALGACLLLARAVQLVAPHPVFSVFAASGLGGALMLGLQVARPYRCSNREWLRELRVDLLHMVFSNGGANTLFGVFGLGSTYAAAAFLAQALGRPLWPTELPVFLQLPLALLVADLGFYLVHRMCHENDFFWRFHAVHHSAEHLHGFSAARNHPLNALFIYMAQIVPLVLLGTPDDVMALVTVVIAVNGWLQHADVDWEPGWLDRWLATGPVHRLHHSASPHDERCNYSSNLVFWDRVMGTLRRPGPEDRPARYGLSRGQLPERYLDHLVAPFVWSRYARGVED
ncbi:MAG: sterol desaturase family protein [Alphaproteobacteria bacterium]|nr:sterol desaturase family protein [Alphaproteobacteria bacterium]